MRKNGPFAMRMMAPAALLGAIVLAGCRFHSREITSLQRKEAANLVSEAQFAVTLKDWSRAEGLFAQAAELCPDTGDYWVDLGMVRVRLGKRGEAKSDYASALSAFKDAVSADPSASQPVLQEIYTLVLMGRMDDARRVLEKERSRRPDDSDLRAFAESGRLDQIRTDPGFKEAAL